ncbi:MAG: GNAT family N-acetyltransferase [Phycisphaeraceae bacterium]
MVNPTVIEADLSDAMHAVAIVDLLNEYAQEPMIDAKPLDDAVRATLIDRLREHPTTHVFLAKEDDQFIGLAICFRGFSTFRARPLINVHDIAVRKAWRGKGVGRLLLTAVEAFAVRNECCSITLEVKDYNEPARRAYLAVGFEEGTPGKDATRFMTKRL